MTSSNQANLMMELLKAEGFTHCFFLPGGNSMHLLEAASFNFECVAFIHEHSAVVAAEYFNETSKGDRRAFVLLTAGPALTNAVTGIAGAFTEKRELVVIGGTVKSTDLSDGRFRQIGIQEVPGVEIVSPICVRTLRVSKEVDPARFLQVVRAASVERGPVFIEVCLDAQARPLEVEQTSVTDEIPSFEKKKGSFGFDQEQETHLEELVAESNRPVILLGGGVPRSYALQDWLESLGVPVMTTYNGADRFGSNRKNYCGRPNTWGMRYSNLIIGSCDLIVAVGTRLGLQQTGFNWQDWAPCARVIQVDIDQSEMVKHHPCVDLKLAMDSKDFLEMLRKVFVRPQSPARSEEWLSRCQEVKRRFPLSEVSNSTHDGYLNPYDFYHQLSQLSTKDDNLIPSSSGSAFTVFYQSFLPKEGQVIITNKCLASMGYALPGAIGASLANGRRTIHVEGDGSLMQQVQEYATISNRSLPIKSFVWMNDGYASIRTTQRNYFGGNYLGCDAQTGLGSINLKAFAKSVDIHYLELGESWASSSDFLDSFAGSSPAIYGVPVHPEQTFFPKIGSSIRLDGGMSSDPLWDIGPKLGDELMVATKNFLEGRSEK